MILADKIITLRKKNGWSQEELAEKLNVTRQSVSKWEGAQSVPDLNKILLMSRIFEVSTDYLLKDELEEPDGTQNTESLETGGFEESVPARRVSMEEARAFLDIKEKLAGKIAFAVSLCIVSPVCLIFLGAAQETGRISISENMAAGAGLLILLLAIAIAVAVFISSGIRMGQYDYLDKDRIETDYGVTGMVKDQKSEYQGTYTRYHIIGTCCCILAATPLFTMLMFTEEDFMMAMAVCVLLFIVAIGVYFFVVAGVRWESMQKLLQEGDYTIDNKKNEAAFEPVSKAYWLVATAIYLGYSFYTNAWEISWIVWPVAGVLFAAVKVIYVASVRNKHK
ncbi:helix-turn-helix transcriptional regulator [Lachnospiraceae bacterium MD308]|nr:helix-turn-helix transcriptional regulator [Lachnospiraceae bacterium MD308]MCI8580297.1 helix-turn-helix transcriptional regulator [Dorea sp.]